MIKVKNIESLVHFVYFTPLHMLLRKRKKQNEFHRNNIISFRGNTQNSYVNDGEITNKPVTMRFIFLNS